MANATDGAAKPPDQNREPLRFGAESGTALDYLWEGHIVSLFEPMEPPALPGGAAEGQSAISTSPVSPLEKHNSWLASFDLYQSIVAQENHNDIE
jgi:hypothetical protein